MILLVLVLPDVLSRETGFKDRRSLEVVYWYEQLAVLITTTSLIKITYNINSLARFKLIS